MQINNIRDIQVKTDDGWYISVSSKPYNDMVDVWFACQEGGNTKICHFNKTGTGILTKLIEGELNPEPTMRINRFMWDGFRKAILGIEETPKEIETTSELKATRYHLEDMRKLLKLSLTKD